MNPESDVFHFLPDEDADGAAVTALSLHVNGLLTDLKHNPDRVGEYFHGDWDAESDWYRQAEKEDINPQVFRTALVFLFLLDRIGESQDAKVRNFAASQFRELLVYFSTQAALFRLTPGETALAALVRKAFHSSGKAHLFPEAGESPRPADEKSAAGDPYKLDEEDINRLFE